MIEHYKVNDFISVVDFVRNCTDCDFYLTENNTRNIIKDDCSLKKLLKISKDIYLYEDKGDVYGIILVWKSIGNNIPRYYVKINAVNTDIAKKLLTVLLWNTKNDLFIKIRKESKFLNVFREKGFEFKGDRGKEILLMSTKESRKINDKYTKQN